MRMVVIVLGLIALLGVGIPIVSSFGGDNEASRLVNAAERTQEKADSVSRSYNDVIPPPPRTNPAGGSPVSERAGTSQRSSGAIPRAAGSSADEEVEGAEQPTPTPAPTLTPGEHAVADAMDFLARVDAEFGPQHTEYTAAVSRLKRAWSPRYARAIDEYHRFEGRVEHARDMAYEYLEIQQRLTVNITNSGMRRTHEERDAREQILILEWMNQADTVLEEARAIKYRLDDMNIAITKLELSATFASVYEGFHQMPLAITLLNGELEKFREESELIYKTFGPQDGN